MQEQETTSPVRSMMVAMLAARGHEKPVGDHESLFFSGRLDSLAATEVMLMLESDYGVDLADADFDITRLDTIAEIEALIAGRS